MAVARAITAIVVLLAPLTGCVSSSGGLDGTEWLLVEMGPGTDVQELDADSAITLEFIAGEDKVTGSLVCNMYYASYQANKSDLSIGQQGGTSLWCEPPEHTQLEHSYLDALRTARAYSLQGNKLVVYCDVIQLVFERIQ